MTILSLNWMNAWHCVYFCCVCPSFIFAVYVLANDSWTKCNCVCACKSGPFGCTPKPWQQADTIRTYLTQQLFNTNNTMCTTQWKQHNLAFSWKLTTKTFIEFPKFNWSYHLLCYMLQTLFIWFINQKYTPTDLKQVQSCPTAGTKSILQRALRAAQ